jgi:hypothetical protein
MKYSDQRARQKPFLPLKCPFEETNQLYDKIFPDIDGK